ncbi:MAG: hypothetical protein IPL84_16530 [Chitinophagaceae bacterium]|nr:hypothetical protein [Chitinophagaceae bacterium]
MNISLKFAVRSSIIFISAAFIFYSCTKIDTKTPAFHSADFAEKFFLTEVPHNKEVSSVIELLKKENGNSGFVNKLPFKCGLPVWD